MEMAEASTSSTPRDTNKNLSNSGGDTEIEMALQSSAPGDTNGHRLTSEADPESPNPQQKYPSTMWIASAYNITAIIGIGVLGLPQAMTFLKWGPGVVILLLAFFITYFTLKQLTQLHEFEYNENGQRIRYETYYQLGQRAFGPRRGLWIILPLQMVVEISLDILFTVAAGEAMNRIYDNFTECNTNRPIHIFVWFAVFAVIQIILSLVKPNFESIKGIIIIAAIMSICYSTIAWITVLSVGGPEEQWHSANSLSTPVNYTLPEHLLVDHCVSNSTSHSDHTKLGHADLVFRAFNAIGVVAFAYAAHNVVLEIQNGIPSTPDKSSEAEMLRVVKITYVVVAMCYLPMGIAFYKTYGNQISQNALSFLQYQTGASRILVTFTNFMLIIHLIGSYQIFGIPVFILLEVWYTRDIKPMLKGSSQYIKRSTPHLIRPLYIVLTAVLAMIFPFFSPLLGFFGGFAIAPTTFFLPCIIWLKIKNPEKWSKDWWLNWGCIVLGVLLMIVASIGGAYVFIKDSLSDKYRLWTHNWPNSTLYLTNNGDNSNLFPPNTWQKSILHSTCDLITYNNICKPQ